MFTCLAQIIVLFVSPEPEHNAGLMWWLYEWSFDRHTASLMETLCLWAVITVNAIFLCRRTAKTQTHFNSNSHLETFIQCHFKLDINRFDQTLTNEHFSSCCVDFILTRADEAPQKVSVTDAFVEMLHFTGVFDSHDWFIL